MAGGEPLCRTSQWANDNGLPTTVSRFLLPADFVKKHGAAGPPWPREQALQYTRWLARRHYENFQVASSLLPRELHQDFYNIYAFCRWADDLGDEMEDPERSVELLAWWNSELGAMYSGQTSHPVYVALAETVAKHRIPRQPFADLIHAFVRDQEQTRYETYEDLLDYCRYSANPVGQLVLHVCGYTDPGRIELSNFTCTALQLANFWQDVKRDWRIGRVYIPLDAMARHGYSLNDLERDIEQGLASDAFRSVLRDLVSHAEELFQQGLPLIGLVDRGLAVDLDLFSSGGLAILEKIRRRDYDVLSRRPTIGKLGRLRLLARALRRKIFENNAAESSRGSSAA
jgi:squalene synthase HpnC